METAKKKLKRLSSNPMELSLKTKAAKSLPPLKATVMVKLR